MMNTPAPSSKIFQSSRFSLDKVRPELSRSELGQWMLAGPRRAKETLSTVSEQQARDAWRTLHAHAECSGSTSGTLLPPTRLRPLLERALSPASDKLFEQLLHAAAHTTWQRFGRHRQIYAPLYVSNACTNCCKYCGFSSKNPIARQTLQQEEIASEADALRTLGYRQVLLVCGEAPKIFGVEQIEKSVGLLSQRFARVGLEVFPLHTAQYARLHEAGVDHVSLYQETYDPLMYDHVHDKGKKRNLLWRLQGPVRILSSGISEVGLGVLLGLSPWRFEAIALALHLAELSVQFPAARLSVSFPRLRPAQGGFKPTHPVCDRDLLHMMAVLRLCAPNAHLVLSTRESPRFRDRLCSLLATKLSAGSVTSPGGYSSLSAPPDFQRTLSVGEPRKAHDESRLAQFSIGDSRSAAEVRRALRQEGLTPHG